MWRTTFTRHRQHGGWFSLFVLFFNKNKICRWRREGGSEDPFPLCSPRSAPGLQNTLTHPTTPRKHPTHEHLPPPHTHTHIHIHTHTLTHTPGSVSASGGSSYVLFRTVCIKVDRSPQSNFNYSITSRINSLYFTWKNNRNMLTEAN